eukprot:snap_masked-scaffold_34-processed-gene-3.36-mRNA-1 protein AED:1.00 eAED:1.00 QI:0/-1/0/0/-1/1/1/0/348
MKFLKFYLLVVSTSFALGSAWFRSTGIPEVDCKGFVSREGGSLATRIYNYLFGIENEMIATSPWSVVLDSVLDDSVSDQLQYIGGLTPVFESIGVSYLGTELTQNVTGFTLIAALRPADGLNAVAYLYNGAETFNSDITYVMIAFRGTFSAADSCANEIYFGFGDPRSEACEAAFTLEQLDYVSQADAFVQSVVNSLGVSKVRLLLTGHSLGSSIGNYMGSFYQNKNNRAGFTSKVRVAAFGWASPGFRSVDAVEPTSVSKLGCNIMAYNNFDPVSATLLANQAGYICTYPEGDITPTEACVECYDQENPSLGTCGACRDETHNFLFYVNLLSDPSVTIPTCEYVPLA